MRAVARTKSMYPQPFGTDHSRQLSDARLPGSMQRKFRRSEVRASNRGDSTDDFRVSGNGCRGTIDVRGLTR